MSLRIPARRVLEEDYNQLEKAWLSHLQRCGCNAGDSCPVRRAIVQAIDVITKYIAMWEES